MIGQCKDSETAGKIIRELSGKGILTFLVGKIIDQAVEQGVKMGID